MTKLWKLSVRLSNVEVIIVTILSIIVKYYLSKFKILVGTVIWPNKVRKAKTIIFKACTGASKF